MLLLRICVLLSKQLSQSCETVWQVRIAVVGQGTSQILTAKQDPLLRVHFTPPTVSCTKPCMMYSMLIIALERQDLPCTYLTYHQLETEIHCFPQYHHRYCISTNGTDT